MKKLFYLFPFFILLLTGCVHEFLPPAPPEADPTATKLAEAAVAVSSSLQTLEGIRKSENPDYKKMLPNPEAYGLTTLASIDWVGPIEPVVLRIARASDYRIRVLGSSPAIPIIVQIRAKDTPLSYILRDVDYQAGTKADIYVYPQSKVIELRYRNNR